MQPSRPVRFPFASDEALVKECLTGNQDAWNTLLQKYRNLIYSIPLKYGLSRDDANDIFQQVCIQLLRYLGELRDFKSLPAWLITVTTRLCSDWIIKERRFEAAHGHTDWVTTADMPQQLLRELEQEQVFREEMARLKPRCRELLHMLFFETPALPYATVAKKMGLAAGSIGFTRLRCLQRLRRQLEDRGFV
jgi:RNA polymerase sigma factor (sigma-70 family)